MFVTGHASTADQPCSSQHLNAMADGEDPLLRSIESPDNFQQADIVPQVLGRPAAKNERRVIVLDFYLIECQICLEPISLSFNVGVPSRLEVVHHKMQPPACRSRNHGLPAFLPKPVNRVKRFIRLTAITRDDKNSGHAFQPHWISALLCRRLNITPSLTGLERRMAQALDLAGITNTGGAPSFAFFAKGGSRKCRHPVGLITCLQQNQIAHAASRPTLA